MRWANDPRFAHLNFPKPIQMADGSVGFYEHEIDAWLASGPRVGASQPALPVELRVDRPAPDDGTPRRDGRRADPETGGVDAGSLPRVGASDQAA